MKPIFFFLILITGIVQAQDIKVIAVEQISSLKVGEYILSAVSPDGNNVLASSPGYKGLVLIDISSKQIRKITDEAGAGYEPAFSNDGAKVFFRSDEFVGLKRYFSLKEYDIVNGKTEMLENKSRELTSPFTLNNKLIYSIGGRLKERTIGSGTMKKLQPDICVILENLTPVLFIDGLRKPIIPSGEGNYIWVSLSPDKTKLLYNYRGSGTYICTLDGIILDDLGRMNAPRWLNNQIIVGMNDKDDGYRILSSDIICYSLVTKQKTNLTSTSDKIEMYPMPVTESNKIVYQTLTGELFIMYLNIK
jgi:hypothetical protein